MIEMKEEPRLLRQAGFFFLYTKWVKGFEQRIFLRGVEICDADL